jgi:Na+/H+ antiporter NhaD/arsenite permease-like protein
VQNANVAPEGAIMGIGGGTVSFLLYLLIGVFAIVALVLVLGWFEWFADRFARGSSPHAAHLSGQESAQKNTRKQE